MNVSPYYSNNQYIARMHIDKSSSSTSGEILFNLADGKTGDISLTDGFFKILLLNFYYD